MSGQGEALVLLARDAASGIATLTLNRPLQYNALSQAVLAELQAALDSLRNDAGVRVVVLAAAGKAFCAGHDLRELRATEDAAFHQALFRQCSKVMLAIAALPQPVIARVQGAATAAGCQLVAACDLAIASEDARFAVSGVNLGLFCATPAVALTRNVSRKRAFEMLVSGEFIDATTAAEYGLINRAVPAGELDAEVLRLALVVAAKSPVAIAAGKRLFYRQLELGVEAAYQLAAETMACNLQDDAARAGIDAFLSR